MAENGPSLGFIHILSVTIRLEKPQKLTCALSLVDHSSPVELVSTSEQATQTQQLWKKPMPNMYVRAYLLVFGASRDEVPN